MRSQKTTFKKIFAGTAILMAVLPFIVTFSAFLTSLFDRIGWYVWLQDLIVPIEARLVAVLLKSVNITGVISSDTHFAMLLEKGDTYIPVDLQWNCLGWQSMILLGITLAAGLRGDWTRLTKIQVIIFGILGTFLINIFRMALVTSLAYYVNRIAAMIIHDYFAAFVALIWLIFFWWFSYSYVLESKKVFVGE